MKNSDTAEIDSLCNAQAPAFVVVCDGGLVQSIGIENWPAHLPLPNIAVIDYDIGDAGAEDLIEVEVDGKRTQAVGHTETPWILDDSPDKKDWLQPSKVVQILDDRE